MRGGTGLRQLVAPFEVFVEMALLETSLISAL